MANTLTIRNPRYYKPFDNSDNPCCWQVNSVAEDIITILEASEIEYDTMPEDWGTAIWWWSKDGVEHSLMITCSNIDRAQFDVAYGATRKKLFGLRREDVTDVSDFRWLLPSLMKLNGT